ncbi:MAG TPA: S8 family serine peptidase, partial [Anaerolineales bacterium]
MKAKWFKLFSLMLVLAVALAVLAVPVAAQDEVPLEPLEPLPSNETGVPTHENTGLYFVELRSAPLAEGGSANSLNADRRAFEQAARNANVGYSVRFDFRNLWNGYSLALTRGNASELSLLDGVKAVYPVAVVSIPETATISPDLATALDMTGASAAQSELGYTGEGIRVAVMDTGVDYDHPDLGGCFGAGCRVVAGYDFVGDDFDANPSNSTYNLTTSPDNDPDDCNGHGTHVAGIVGASGEVTGVAPGVTFGAYRVFGCNGSTTADIMIAAMERALADNMDILNMSIGSAFQWPQYPTSQAATRLVNKGMVVVASIGNSGADGLYSAGSPGLGDKVIGVASFDNSHINVLTFNVNPSGQQVGY